MLSCGPAARQETAEAAKTARSGSRPRSARGMCMTPSSTVVPFAPGPVSNGLFTRSNHDDYRQLMQQGLNLVQQCLQHQQQPFSGILPQELAADFERGSEVPTSELPSLMRNHSA